MAKIFISYRREDSGFAVDQLHGALKPYVENPARDIFIDVDNIPPGVDFVQHLDQKVAQCEVMLVAIGQRWLDATDPETGARRLDDPDDFVRIEIERALARDIPVVPVLIGGATMPPASALPDELKPLTRRQATPIGRGRVDEDVAGLARGLGLSKPDAPKGKGGLIAALVALAIMGGGAAYWFTGPMGDTDTQIPAVAETLEDALASPDDPPGSAPDFSALEDAPPVGKGFEDPDDEPEGESAADAETRERLIRRLQTALIALDQMNGPVDGIAGRGTTQSATRFARAQGMSMPAIQTGPLATLETFVIKAEQAAADKEAEDRAAAARRQRQADAEATKRREVEGAYNAGVTAYRANYAEARTHFAKACDGGHMGGCNSLGNMYLFALGGTQDYTRARQLFNKACDGGNESACRNSRLLGD